jgi:ATP-dependent helicase/nuclease subunit B
MNDPQPERHFLGWTESAAHSVARWMRERRQSLATEVDGVLDFSDTLVIVPGAGARRQVLSALRRTVEGAMIPPNIATPGKFVSNAFETPAGACVAGPLDRLAAIARALASSDSLRAALVPSTGGTTLAALARPAKRLLDVIDRADDAHCSVEAIADLELLQASPGMREAWHNLARLRAAMKQELEKRGRALGVQMIERSDAVDLAAKDWRPRCGALILAGLPDLARNVAFLSRRLAALRFRDAPVQLHALVLAPRDRAHGFDDLGVVLGVDASAAPRAAAPDAGFAYGPEITDAMIEVAGDPADQAAAAAARYSKLAGPSDTGETALVLADESLLPTMARAFAEHGRSLHAGGGLPFSHTEVGRCLERLDRAAQSGDPASFVELVRVPELSGQPAETQVDLVQELDEVRQWMKPASTKALWGGFVNRTDYAVKKEPPESVKRAAREAVRKAARQLESKLRWCLADLSPDAAVVKPLGDRWALLEQWMHALFASSDCAATGRALEEFIKTMRRAQESAAAVEPGTAADAISLAQMLCAEISVPDAADASSVDTVGWLETLFEPAGKFVLAGVCEGILPSSPQPDGWFTEAIRERIGLPGRAARFARDAYLLHALAARSGPERLAIVAGRFGAGGDPLKPSRLLMPSDPVGVARRILLLTDPGAATVRHRIQGAATTSAKSAFIDPPQAKVEALDTMHATDFAAYIGNPYRYWLERVLKLKAPEPDEMELNAAEFGTLLHHAAQGLADESVVALDAGAPDYEERCFALLAERLDTQARRIHGSPLRPAIQLQVREMKSRLRHLVRWQRTQLQLGWRIRATEWRTEVPLDVDGQIVTITMRVDRIDFHPEHGWRIIDYKSSDKGYELKKEVFNGREWFDLQLPLYKCLIGQGEAANPSLTDLAASPPEKIEVGVLAMPSSTTPCGFAPLDEPAENGLEKAREIIRDVRAGKFTDSGEDPGDKFARVRRALCLSTGESGDADDAGDGAAQ